MYNLSKNEITFPHVVPTPILGGKLHTWSNVNGGAKMLADFDINPNKFFGGNVEKLGWITEYGMYACKRRMDENMTNNATITGFYVHDPSKLTKVGRDLFKKAFPSATVRFEIHAEKPPTPAEIKKRKDLQKYYLEHGMSPEMVNHATAEELVNLAAALDSGKSKISLGEVEEREVRNQATKPGIETKSGEKIAFA